MIHRPSAGPWIIRLENLMARISGVFDDHAQGNFALCHDNVIEGHLPTYQAASDALESFAEQARSRAPIVVIQPFWALQAGDQSGNSLPETAAQALFGAAFGPTFTTDYGVTYAEMYGIVWVARFSWKGTPIELCFNALDIWRVSMIDRCDSVPFLHFASWPVLRKRLNQALDRLTCS
jgi:hypothetical protein